MKKSYYLAIIVFAINLSGFSQSTLWGLADQGIFEYNPIDSSLFERHIFPTNTSEGANPWDGMLYANRKLYYTMRVGGNYNLGTLNMFDPSTNVNTVLHHFDGNNGSYPYCKLSLAPNGLIYGSTAGDDASSFGTIFTIDTASNSYQEIADAGFAGSSIDGPFGNIVFENDSIGLLLEITTINITKFSKLTRIQIIYLY